ncbi:hypothetical protein V5Z48_004724 [Salmonella enterica]
MAAPLPWSSPGANGESAMAVRLPEAMSFTSGEGWAPGKSEKQRGSMRSTTARFCDSVGNARGITDFIRCDRYSLKALDIASIIAQHYVFSAAII